MASAGPATSDPIGAPSPLDRQTDTMSNGAARSVGVSPVAAAAFHSLAPSQWSPSPARSAQARSARSRSTGCTVPPAKLCVFSTLIAAVDTRCGPASGSASSARASRSTRPTRIAPRPRGQPADGGVGAEFGPGDVRSRLAQQFLPGPDEARRREQVREGAGDAEQRGILAEQPGDLLLEREDRWVLAVDVVADLGRGHGCPHAARRGG